MIVPLHNSLLKLLKQSEVYLMEEAVTDQILKSGQNISHNAINPQNFVDSGMKSQQNDGDILNHMEASISNENTRRQHNPSAYEKALNPKMPVQVIH